MKKVNWTEVEEANFGDRLPVGGYVVRIQKVEDDPKKEQLQIIFDIAEGQYANKYASTPADRDWTHRIYQRYSDSAAPFFKGFLTALEKSNPGFTVSEWQKQSNEQAFVGLIFGAIFGEYNKVSERSGKVVATTVYDHAVSADTIRSGKFTVPDPRYSDDAKQMIAEEAAMSSDPYQDDLPF